MKPVITYTITEDGQALKKVHYPDDNRKDTASTIFTPEQVMAIKMIVFQTVREDMSKLLEGYRGADHLLKD